MRRTSPTATAPSKRGAFTLLEMMAVVAIVAIAASLVVGNLGAVIPGYRLAASGRAVQDTVGRAVAIAAGRREPVALVYDIEARTVSIQLIETPPERPGDEREVEGRLFETSLERGIEIVEVVDPKGRTHRSGEVQVRVGERGIIEGHVVYIADSSERERTIEVAPLGAATRVLEGHVDASLFD